MLCNKCNVQGEHKVFDTFSYWLCPDCKSEITSAPNKFIGLKKSLEIASDYYKTNRTISLPNRTVKHLNNTDLSVNWIYINNKYDLKKCIPHDCGWYLIRQHDGRVGVVYEYPKFWDGNCWYDSLPSGWTQV